jgi:hypothetical protein
MSSLAASRADNYYYDPAHFDPSKRRGSANAIAGSHPLGVRANKLKTEGILVIRFEMPYDSWCDGCGEHIARGIRFNAGAFIGGSISPDGCGSPCFLSVCLMESGLNFHSATLLEFCNATLVQISSRTAHICRHAYINSP